MEWVETTGRTLEDAKDVALDELGVDEREAEFEVLEEPRAGLFGRPRGEARVRARVRPTQPRPKAGRRERRGRDTKRGRSRRGGGGEKAERGGEKAERNGGKGGGEKAERGGEKAQRRGGKGGGEKAQRRGGKGGAEKARRAGGKGGGEKARRSRGTAERSARQRGDREGKTKTMDDNELTVDQQGEIVDEFLDGLLDAFGVDGDVEVDRVDDDTVEIRIEGDDLGLLIGPSGNTLTSLQELSKTVVQRHATGAHHGRIRVDVGGYRQRRREALAGFAQQVADEVRESGTEKGLEPMGAADRKVVHDAVGEVAGVATISEGQEPRRRVVIVLDEDA